MAKTSIITALLVGFALLCYIPYSSSNSSRNIDPELQEKIDEFITNVYLPATGLTSLGMALVKDDGDILYTTGFGYADHENKILNGNDTQFSIGSITKARFTYTKISIKMLNYEMQLSQKTCDMSIKRLFCSEFHLNSRSKNYGRKTDRTRGRSLRCSASQIVSAGQHHIHWQVSDKWFTHVELI